MSVARFLLTVVEARGVRSGKAGSYPPAFTTAARASALSLPSAFGLRASLRTSAETDRLGTEVTHMAYQAAGWTRRPTWWRNGGPRRKIKEPAW